MNDDARNDDTGMPVYLNNKYTPGITVLSRNVPYPNVDTDAVASAIVPGAHIPPSGQKEHTTPFSLVNMKKMTKKEKIDSPTAPDAPTASPVDTYALSPGLTLPKSPYLLRNRNFPTSSISTKKPQK